MFNDYIEEFFGDDQQQHGHEIKTIMMITSIKLTMIITSSSKPSLSACFQSPMRVRRA